MIPVLILAFLRKNQLEKIIRIAYSQQIHKIYISIDGPRTVEDEKIQEEIIEMINSLRKELPVQIIARHLNENYGAGAAVISGIDWFFDQEKKGIIFEDDLTPEPGFFSATKNFLDRNDIESKILMFSGTNFFETKLEEVQLLRYPVVWGWGTTQEKWRLMRGLIFSPVEELSLNKLGSEYFYWKIGKKRALLGRTKVWDVPLAGAMFNGDFYCAIAPTNMIKNIGHDGFASNTQKERWPLNLPTEDRSLDFETISITNENQERLEREMRKKVFDFSCKYFLSSFFWNFFDFLRWRKIVSISLSKRVASIRWETV
jgi:hypothetical protein